MLNLESSTVAPSFAQRAGDTIGSAVTTSIRHVVRRRNLIITWAVLGYAMLAGYLSVYGFPDNAADGALVQNPDGALSRRWGWDERPQTEQCYRQERTAMLLAVFLGPLGVDQFYARHWPLAVFKLLTAGGLGVWALIDVILWIVGGVYGTRGCPGGAGPGREWAY